MDFGYNGFLVNGLRFLVKSTSASSVWLILDCDVKVRRPTYLKKLLSDTPWTIPEISHCWFSGAIHVKGDYAMLFCFRQMALSQSLIFRIPMV